jgi:FlaG/FlaF family flagellin (archaellin)
VANGLTIRQTTGRLGWNGACIAMGQEAGNARWAQGGNLIMRRKILSLVLGSTLAIAAVAPAAAAPPDFVQLGGAAGLVAAVVQVAADVNVENINVLNNSANNLLQNADIDVLNNVLNNSLNQWDIAVNVNGNTITILGTGVGGGDTVTVFGS